MIDHPDCKETLQEFTTLAELLMSLHDLPEACSLQVILKVGTTFPKSLYSD
jgi:hypothetical protein